MKVSIIIINYNVKYFLDQCIASILQSEFDEEYEIIVIDNASTDKSVEFIRQKYPEVILIENKENVGFSKANNQGVELSKGEFVLILNPDTILSTHTLKICHDFYKKNQNAGIIGVRMYDGSGAFLPESKRGFPTPFVSFCKIFGLAQLFPSSRIFNQYYLGHLDEEINHEVDTLTGAFMFMRKDIFLEVGGFDEDYFMYGEDIDLSYRVRASGYSNHYLSETNIIHFKGESTRKMSFDYVRRFYEAMIIFAKKHTAGSSVLAYTLAIKSAIYLKAFFTFFIGMIKKMSKPIRDAFILGLAFYVSKTLWEQFYFGTEDYFSDLLIRRNLLIYIFISLLMFLVLGKYHKKFKQWRTIKILFVNLLALLVVYSLFPSDFRFSRAVLLIGAFLGSAIIYLIDLIVSNTVSGVESLKVNTVIVGDPDQSDRMLALLDKREKSNLIGFINTDRAKYQGDNYIGDIDTIESVIRFHGIDEIIFDQHVVTTTEIMRVMSTMDHACQYKIFTSETGSLVGSYSKEFRGQIDAFDVEYAISSSYHRFIKRLGDILISILTVIWSPILWPINGFRMSYFSNVLLTFLGKNTWVGYVTSKGHSGVLPVIKKSILGHASTDFVNRLNDDQKMNLDFIYAREYSFWIDARAFISQLGKLG